MKIFEFSSLNGIVTYRNILVSIGLHPQGTSPYKKTKAKNKTLWPTKYPIQDLSSQPVIVELL